MFGLVVVDRRAITTTFSRSLGIPEPIRLWLLLSFFIMDTLRDSGTAAELMSLSTFLTCFLMDYSRVLLDRAP